MGKNEDFNIFDQSRKELGKKKEKAPLGPLHAKKPEVSLPSGKTSSNAEEMLNKIREMDDDLQKKVDRICELCGMSKRELTAYIENPQNFSTNQWQKAQILTDKLEQQIYEVLGIQQKKKDLKKKKIKLTKERRGKTLGGRKGWLQM